MRRIIVILILFQFLGFYKLLPEAGKIPFLISHYIETERDHNFLEFLKEHYTSENNHHGKGHDHGNLPFKNSDDGSSKRVSNNYYSENTPESELNYILPELNRGKFRVGKVFYPITFSNTIWQPPRIG